MGTSRRRIRRRPSQPSPREAPGPRCRGEQKIRKQLFGFKGRDNFLGPDPRFASGGRAGCHSKIFWRGVLNRAGYFLSRFPFPSHREGVEEDDMTDLDRGFDENVYDLNAILHPGSVFDHPRDVLADTTLSRAEKRAILASWASDAAAVTSCPSLRAIPGAKRTVSIDDILEALSSLDHSPRNPPGGKPARLKSTDRTALAA